MRDSQSHLLSRELMNFGKKWLLEFRSKKQKPSQSAGKRILVKPVMDRTTISNNETLEGLGFTVDGKRTWLAHIDRVVKQSRQRLGTTRQVRRYLNNSGVYTVLVRPKIAIEHFS